VTSLLRNDSEGFWGSGDGITLRLEMLGGAIKLDFKSKPHTFYGFWRRKLAVKKLSLFKPLSTFQD
jgi:hypothetical protein